MTPKDFCPIDYFEPSYEHYIPKKSDMGYVKKYIINNKVGRMFLYAFITEEWDNNDGSHESYSFASTIFYNKIQFRALVLNRNQYCFLEDY